jgi:hypothetical protein
MRISTAFVFWRGAACFALPTLDRSRRSRLVRRPIRTFKHLGRAAAPARITPPAPRAAAPRRDETLKLFLQNLLDSMLFAFMWGNSRYWSVHMN